MPDLFVNPNCAAMDRGGTFKNWDITHWTCTSSSLLEYRHFRLSELEHILDKSLDN